MDGPLRETVETGVAADDYDRPNRAVRATLAAFGVGFLAFAGALLTVEPSSANANGSVVLVYAALAFGVFGAGFLSLAARSG